MEYESRSSLRMGTQCLSEDYLKHHKKYRVKYIHKLSFPQGFRLQNNQLSHKFFSSVKVLYKVTSTNPKDHDLELNLQHAINYLKEKRSLTSLPIKIKFSQDNLKRIKSTTFKLFRCLRSLTELDLILTTEMPKELLPVIKYTITSTQLRSYHIKLSSVDQELLEIPQVFKGLYKKLNKISHISDLCFNLKGVQLSDNSLQQLFAFNQLKKPVKSLRLLTDRLENIEDTEDDFDDFDDEFNGNAIDNAKSLEKTWKTFVNLESFAPTLTELHLQPLFRNASDHAYLRELFIPLAKLTNLQSLVLELPHLELTEYDVKALGSALSQLKNLKKFFMLIQFGMVSQKTLTNFFLGMQGLDLYEAGLNLNFLTEADHSSFFKALESSPDLRTLRFKVSYMADFHLGDALCDQIRMCTNLKHVDLTSIHLAKGLKPSRKTWNAHMQLVMRTLQDCKELESLSVYVSKMSGINENIEGLIELVPNLPNLKDLIFDVEPKQNEIDYELGKMFWQTIFQNNNNLRKLVVMFRFRNAEKLMSMFIPNIELMRDLECFYTQFSSDKIDPEQILRLIKQIVNCCKFIEAIRLNFKLKTFLDEEMILRIQQTFNKSRFLKHGLIEVQCDNKKQKIFPDQVILSAPPLET